MILFKLQLSDGVVRNGEYGSFFDHYGDNFEALNPGDVLVKQETGALILIYDRTYYFQMHAGKIDENQREIEGLLYTYPRKQDSLPRMFKKVGRVPYYYPTFALVSKFLGKFLPFHWNYCNKFNYMKYILYGQLTRNEKYFKECPLAASWVGLDDRVIRSGDFQLEDSNGMLHDFSEYSKSKYGPPSMSWIPGARAESSSQVTRSGSSKQLERSKLSLQRASSMDRMVKNLFTSTSKKKKRSGSA